MKRKWWLWAIVFGLLALAGGCNQQNDDRAQCAGSSQLAEKRVVLQAGDTTAAEYIMRGQRRIELPHVQGILYALTAACLGTESKFGEVEWYEAAAIVNLTSKKFAAGLFLVLVNGRNLIILDSEYVSDPATITHESMSEEPCVQPKIQA